MKNIILFDGVCHFCQHSVQFIIKRDPKDLFQFASLQSEIGKKLSEQYHIPSNENSLILIEYGEYFSKSTAVLRICKQLPSLWKLFYLFIIIPKPIRDVVYNLIAKNRHLLFRNNKACPIPGEKMKQKFL